MKAIIWGSSGSLPTPLSSGSIKEKMRALLWAARDQELETPEDINTFLDTLPHSATGTYKGNTSCVEIDAGTDSVILCDAGSGIRDYALSIGGNSEPRTYHIFLSHLHWDHIQGFPFFTPAYNPANRIIFHGFHPETEQVLRQQMEGPTFPVSFDQLFASIEFDIREPGSSFDIEGIRIETIRQQHPGVSWGYSFQQGDKRIVYSSDSEHGPEAKEPDYPFVQFFKEADILIFDGQYTYEEATNEKRDWGHSDHITAVELASRANVKKLAIFHHEPNYSDADIEKIRYDAHLHLDMYRAKTPSEVIFPKELIIAYDGLTIEA